MMTRRQGIIAVIAGILPVFRIFGQQQPPKLETTTGGLLYAPDPDPVSVIFGYGSEAIQFSWHVREHYLEVLADGRSAHITAAEIMDALEGKAMDK